MVQGVFAKIRRRKKPDNPKDPYKGQLWSRIDEMPIWNWNMITEEGNLIYLFKDWKNRKAISNKANAVWMGLQQQHMDEFGIDISLLDRLKTMRKVIKLNLKFYETKDRSLLNIIAIENSRIEAMKNRAGVKFYKVLDFVSLSRGGARINPRELTVIEWFHALKNMEAKSQQKPNGSNKG